MEKHNIISHQDEKYLELISNLQKIPNEDLITIISDFWLNLKTEGINQRENESYLADVMSNIKITKANLLFNIIHEKVIV